MDRSEWDICPKCRGDGKVITNEVNDQYDHTWLQWEDCPECQGEGYLEPEIEEDDE